MYDLGIVNGRIYLGGSWFEGNVYVRNGRIATLSAAFFPARHEHDAEGWMVLPGFIDPHVHFAMTAGKYATVDTFASGSAAAALGGVTTYIDFLDCAGSVTALDQLYRERRKAAENSVVDYGFHAAAVDPQDSPLAMMRAAKKMGMPTMKLYTTYGNCRSSDAFIESLLELSPNERVRILVHAENDSMLRQGRVRVSEHALSRPVAAELTEMVKLAEMAMYRDGWLYLVHVSCGTSVKRLYDLYGTHWGRNLILESAPHYFCLTADSYARSDAWMFTMTPPLRSPAEASLLAEQIDRIQVIGSDHCSFAETDKKQEFTGDVPMGIGGVQYSFPLLFQKFGEKMIDKFTKNVAQVHGLYPDKGSLLPGSDADIVIYEQTGSTSISHRGAGYSPYEGMAISGRVRDTVSRGRFVVRHGVLVGGQGRYVARRL